MRPGRHPARPSGDQPAAGDDAVQVIVIQQGLAPGVQHGRDPHLRPEAVLPKLQQRLAGRLKEQV